jgi:hypothetical protein
LAHRADPHPNHLAAAVEITAQGLLNFRTDRCQALGKFGGQDVTPRQSLMVEALQLLGLTGF